MNAQTLLKAIETRGAVVRINGDRLRVRGDHLLTDELREGIRRLKPELSALLALPPLPPSLANIPSIEYSTRRRAWIRRIGGAVWVVPTQNEPAQDETGSKLSESDREHANCVKFSDFVREVRRIKRNLPMCMMKASDAEKREYSAVVACLTLRIDPATIRASLSSLNSVQSDKAEMNA